MSKHNIKSYIEEQIGKGTSKEVIFENLRKVGWNMVDIQIAYTKVAQYISTLDDVKNNTKNTAKINAVKDTSKDSEAIASFVLGICGIFMIAFPVFSLVGLVLGILALKQTSHHAKVVWGIVLSALGLFLGIIFWIILLLFTNIGDHKGLFSIPNVDAYNTVESEDATYLDIPAYDEADSFDTI